MAYRTLTRRPAHHFCGGVQKEAKHWFANLAEATAFYTRLAPIVAGAPDGAVFHCPTCTETWIVPTR